MLCESKVSSSIEPAISIKVVVVENNVKYCIYVIIYIWAYEIISVKWYEVLSIRILDKDLSQIMGVYNIEIERYYESLSYKDKEELRPISVVMRWVVNFGDEFFFKEGKNLTPTF